MTSSDTWTGRPHQDEERRKSGRRLAPGIYRSVTAEHLRTPCVYVPAEPGPLTLIGADKWAVAVTGERL